MQTAIFIHEFNLINSKGIFSEYKILVRHFFKLNSSIMYYNRRIKLFSQNNSALNNTKFYIGLYCRFFIGIITHISYKLKKFLFLIHFLVHVYEISVFVLVFSYGSMSFTVCKKKKSRLVNVKNI